MGTGAWSSSAWSTYRSTTAAKPAAAIFKSKDMDETLNPLNVVRESRDSDDHPNSVPIMVFVDVTGSMGSLADKIVKKGLGVLMEEILNRKPVQDPQVAFGAIGDVKCDDAPLQVTQFESSNIITEQLEKVFIESGGGGNNNESYTLPWYFAARCVQSDAIEKRSHKGYLFTIGDELPPPTLTGSEIQKVIGLNPQRDYTAKELFEMASESWHVFHLVLVNDGYAERRGDEVMAKWREVMGQHAIPLADQAHLSEVIVSTIQVIEGDIAADVVASTWTDPSVAKSVSTAVAVLSGTTAVATTGSGVTRL